MHCWSEENLTSMKCVLDAGSAATKTPCTSKSDAVRRRFWCQIPDAEFCIGHPMHISLLIAAINFCISEGAAILQ